MEEKDLQRLLDMLYGMIDEAKSAPFSAEKCTINRDEALDILTEIRSRMPLEIKKAQELIALGNGYDSFLMFNVYAQRATSPDDMEKVYNPALHRENLEAFRYILSISDKPAVWAAWGAIIEKRAYLPDCVRDLVSAGEEFGASWYCAGAITKKGHPHHPLYLRKDEKLKPFDVNSYLDKL